MWGKTFYQNKSEDALAVLVGNKIDLNCREVTEVKAKQLSKKMGMFYFEISAKTGENIA